MVGRHDLERLGRFYGALWAWKYASTDDLEDMAVAFHENWIDWRPRKDNGIWEWLKESEDDGYDFERDVADVENWPSGPFLCSVIDGAIEVYNAVRALV